MSDENVASEDQDLEEQTEADRTSPDQSLTDQPTTDGETKKPSKSRDTSNFSEYQRVWILICLDRARNRLGYCTTSKISSKLYRETCAILREERPNTNINRDPSLKGLKGVWSAFMENRQVSKAKRGGPKPKKGREEVETLLQQGDVSFREIVKKLKPRIQISARTVGRIARDMKKASKKAKNTEEISTDLNDNLKT